MCSSDLCSIPGRRQDCFSGDRGESAGGNRVPGSLAQPAWGAPTPRPVALRGREGWVEGGREAEGDRERVTAAGRPVLRLGVMLWDPSSYRLDTPPRLCPPGGDALSAPGNGGRRREAEAVTERES